MASYALFSILNIMYHHAYCKGREEINIRNWYSATCLKASCSLSNQISIRDGIKYYYFYSICTWCINTGFIIPINFSQQLKMYITFYKFYFNKPIMLYIYVRDTCTSFTLFNRHLAKFKCRLRFLTYYTLINTNKY